jgi:hypothetical protein
MVPSLTRKIVGLAGHNPAAAKIGRNREICRFIPPKLPEDPIRKLLKGAKALSSWDADDGLGSRSGR